MLGPGPTRTAAFGPSYGVQVTGIKELKDSDEPYEPAVSSSWLPTGFSKGIHLLRDFFTTAMAPGAIIEPTAATLPSTDYHPHDNVPVATGPVQAPRTGIDVVIIGAGVGGLVAAIECWRKGHDVRIYERNKDMAQHGDAFVISAPGRRWIENWPDMAGDYFAQASLPPWICIRKHDGELLCEPRPVPKTKPSESKIGNAAPKGPWNDYMPIREFGRFPFSMMLYRQVKRLGIPVLFDKRVSEYYEFKTLDRAGVVFDDGSRAEGDIVIAADGIGSKSQELLTDIEGRSQPMGKALYRAGYPVEEAWKDPLVYKTFGIPQNEDQMASFLLASNSHLVAHGAPGLMAWALVHPATGSEQESWHASVSTEEVLATMEKLGGWCEEAKALVRTAPPGTIRNWPLVLRSPSSTWTSPRGRVLQIGDAAHPNLPTSAFGATAAIEDGLTVAACLQLAGKTRLQLATQVYTKLRYARVCTAQKMGLVNMQRWQHADIEKARTDPSAVMPRTHQWLINHDPELYVYQNFEHAAVDCQGGAKFDNTNIPPGAPFEPWTLEDMMMKLRKGEQISVSGDWS